MALIGYARVSSTGQNLDRQLDAFAAAGVERTFTEKLTGSKRSRPQLDACLDYLRDGDVLVVSELARLGRSLIDLISIVNSLGERGIGFRSLKESIDTLSPAGTLVFHIMGSLAQFEREVINQRAAEGRASAKARGKTGGRPRVDPAKIYSAKMLVSGGMSASAAAKATGVSRATLYREGIGSIEHDLGDQGVAFVDAPERERTGGQPVTEPPGRLQVALVDVDDHRGEHPRGLGQVR